MNQLYVTRDFIQMKVFNRLPGSIAYRMRYIYYAIASHANDITDRMRFICVKTILSIACD